MTKPTFFFFSFAEFRIIDYGGFLFSKFIKKAQSFSENLHRKDKQENFRLENSWSTIWRLRTQEFVAEVQKIIENEPSKSMLAIARMKGVDEKLIWLGVHEDIRYFSYKLRMGQFLPKACQCWKKRLKRAKKLINKLNQPLKLGMLRFFFGEKNLCQNQKINS